MSRRKQTVPQRVQSSDLWDYAHVSFESPPTMDPYAHVCSRCCAEFSALSDLDQHQRDCSPNPPVLIVNENQDLLFYSKTFPTPSLPASPAGEAGETANNFEMEYCNTSLQDTCVEYMDCFNSKRVHSSVDSPGSTSSSQGSSGHGGRTEHNTDSVFCTSVLPASLHQPASSAEQGEFSWSNSNVIIENLESTKVAVAQFSQQTHSGIYCSQNSKRAISSLLEQLLALQIQQTNQLQLIDQIHHQVLLLASQNVKIPETPVSCSQDLPLSKPANQLKGLSTHLSQQLAAAAGIAQCLATQSANMSDYKQFKATEQLQQRHPGSRDTLSTSESLQTVGELVTSAVCKHLSKNQYMHSGSSRSKLNFLSQTKMSSLAFSSNSFINKTSDNSHSPQLLSTSQHMASTSIPNIGAVADDLDALAALAQRRKCKATNLTLSEPKSFSKDSLFKHKCRFCAKVFGSDSALQIHLRSHTGERPYKCNICGNRFSTRGNLKVHFQKHKERYPHIKMNPYPVPEDLANIPTSVGIRMSMPPEKPATYWLDSKPSLTTMTTLGSLLQLGSTKLCSLIKKEEQAILIPSRRCQGVLHFASTNSLKTPDSAETGTQHAMTVNHKNEDVKPSLNFVSKMATTKLEESTDLVPSDIPTTRTHSNSLEGIHPLKTSETSKLQQLVENIDKNVLDANECVICHRILSCQSALRMHYRTHTGERPYQCKVCGRSFTTKGNLKTHQAIHHATQPLRVQHSCPICQKKFSNAVVLQQHVRIHMDGQIPNVPLTTQKYPMDCNEGFMSKTKSNDIRSFSQDNNGGFCDRGLSRFHSLSISLSPSPFDKGPIDANKKTSYNGLNGELQSNWIKTEWQEGPTEDGCHTYNLQPVASVQWTGECPISERAISKCLSPTTHASVMFNTVQFDKPFPNMVNSTTLKLSATPFAPSDLKLFHCVKDSPSLIHNLCERGIFKNTACDICGKHFACQSALDIHYRSHTKERPFICTTCNRGFSTKGNLKQHILTHQMRDLPSRLFEPSNPNHASNPSPSMLSNGSQVVKTEVNPFLNTSVGNGRDPSGSSRSSSVSLSPVHATVPPRRTPKQHYCNTCGKSFSSSSALQIHERTHTGERPFACTVCGRAFTTKGNLKVHMGTHMWNSAPTRRGRRLSVDRPMAGDHPVKLPEPPQKNSAVVCNSRDSMYHWSPRTDPLSMGLAMKTHDMSVIQRRGLFSSSGQIGLKERAPALGKLRHADHSDPHRIYGKSHNERGTHFCFTGLIEDRIT